MAKVTIEFHGVCVHVRRGPDVNLPDGVEHRVVLIDGSDPINANGHVIAPHIAKVEVYGLVNGVSEPRASRMLDGQQLRILGAADGMPKAHESFGCAIFSLRTLSEGLAMASSVVVDGERVAGFFDLTGGSIRAEIRHNGAAVAIFESDVPDGAKLEIRNMGGDLEPPIELSGNTLIVVSNVGDANASDQDADFLLNYLISGTIPSDAEIPHHPRPCGLHHQSGGPVFSIGVGCSNTQYP